MSFPLPQRIIVFFLGLGLAWALAQSPAEANEVDWAKLDDYLSSEITRARVPGVVVLAVDREQVIFSGVYGTQASRDPLRLDQPLLIGSLSKSFTALAVMQLVEGGQLDLEGMVEQYLPGVPGGERITIHQLLHHTSGYGAFQDRHHLTVTETSERHSYAGVNYVLLGEIIAAVSGQSYGDYVKEQIFAPLGLTNAYTTLEEARQGGLAIGHRNYFGFPVPEDVGQPAGKDFTSPSEGNLLASASDMGRYLQAFLNRGESIASPASIDQILNDRVPESDTVAYGLGWYFSSRFSEPLWHHGGAAENYQASMILLPTSGRGVVILSN
ncbi:MAG: beta-lactamase family protein, partial [Propionibacteriaceae bacterium]|nr:beta-lactamase family protein [Propionibacteriaceae bacterium]